MSATPAMTGGAAQFSFPLSIAIAFGDLPLIRVLIFRDSRFASVIDFLFRLTATSLLSRWFLDRLKGSVPILRPGS
jgi:hypothetical protein